MAHSILSNYETRLFHKEKKAIVMTISKHKQYFVLYSVLSVWKNIFLFLHVATHGKKIMSYTDHLKEKC